MIAQKIVKTKEAIELEIEEITLLSAQEYETYKEQVKLVNDDWWLRSPGFDVTHATFVNSDGCLYSYGNGVVYVDNAVRPALKVNLGSSNLRIGDEIEWANHNWTVISDELALCDETIAKLPLRRNWRADDANEYEKSDLKKWLENWLAEQMEARAQNTAHS